jgi:hypothetical protein
MAAWLPLLQLRCESSNYSSTDAFDSTVQVGGTADAVDETKRCAGLK